MQSVLKLKVLGILWCDGEAKEKAQELFSVIQDIEATKISANDREFKMTFEYLMDIASELVFDIEYKDKPRPENHSIENIKSIKET